MPACCTHLELDVEPDPDEPDELSLPELLPDDADVAGFAIAARRQEHCCSSCKA